MQQEQQHNNRMVLVTRDLAHCEVTLEYMRDPEPERAPASHLFAVRIAYKDSDKTLEAYYPTLQSAARGLVRETDWEARVTL